MLTTPFTELLGCRLPLQQAPMGGVTTPELVAAVAGAGAVGMVPAQMLPAEVLAALLDDLAGRTTGVVGVTFLLPFGADPACVEVAAAKANPGQIKFASPGFGATQHFTGELFRQTADINILHVPFRTSPEAISAVLGKQVDVLFDTISAVLGQVQSGQFKALAVTGKDRFPAVPDVPAAIESGVLPGYDVTTWYGVFAPRDVPPAIIAKLNKTINESLIDEAVQDPSGERTFFYVGDVKQATAWFNRVPAEITDLGTQQWVLDAARQQRDCPREWFG